MTRRKQKPSNADLARAAGTLLIFVLCFIAFAIIVRHLDATVRP